MNARDSARRRERRMVLLLIPVLLIGTLGGAIAVQWVLYDRTFDATVVWITVAATTLATAVIGGITVAIVAWRRRRGSALFAPSPLWELPHRERTALVRALRRGDPIAPEQRDVARRAATDFARRRGLVWIHLATAVLVSGNIALQEGWQRWFWAGLTLLYLGFAGYFGWLVHRMRVARDRLDVPGTTPDTAPGTPPGTAP